jgi:subtilisin family serine protease
MFGNYIAEFASGTSFSSPIVAAAAALLISHGVPSSDVKEILCSTATPIGFGRPNDT